VDGLDTIAAFKFYSLAGDTFTNVALLMVYICCLKSKYKAKDMCLEKKKEK
jgi:hypothetical protein